MSWNLIPHAEWLETEEQVSRAGEYLLNSGKTNGIAFDTETTGLSVTKDYPLLLSLSDGVRRFACDFNWAHHPWIRDGILQNREVPKIASNAKFDLHMCKNGGIEIQGEVEDTVVMDWLLDENRFSHGLKDTARDHCGIKMLDFKDVFPMRKGTAKTPGETPGEAIRRVMADPAGRAKAIEYAGLDAFSSHRVRNWLREKLHDVSIRTGYSLYKYYQEWEVPFTRVLWNMERRGFTICTGHLRAQQPGMIKAMEQIRGEIAKLAGWDVNLNSPKQLQQLFFGQLGYVPLKYTDGGKSGVKQASTDEEVLTAFVEQGCPYSKLIMEHRKVAKIYGTYIEGLLEWVDPELRIHTNLKQQGTVTGRLSSSDPNLQNIPRDGENDPYKIREAFIAAPGKRLVVCDYDQLEMKLMAHYSGDDRMCHAINTGMDLHCFTVSLMFGADYDEVVKAKKTKKDNLTGGQKLLLDMRQAAKATGFGLIYGIGPLKLAGQLSDELKRKVEKEEAATSIKKYFGVFPGVESFIKGTHRYCQQTEYVQTLLGRFRRLPGINSRGGGGVDGEDGKGIAAEAKRQSVNTIIQGTAADIAKAAMLSAEHDPVLRSAGAQMLLQVHDELIFEVDDHPGAVEETKARVKQLMEKPFGDGFTLRVPLTVGGDSGYTWAEAK